MTKEFNLSDWIFDSEDYKDLLHAENVKEFIRRLKDIVDNGIYSFRAIKKEDFKKEIDKIAGEKLI